MRHLTLIALAAAAVLSQPVLAKTKIDVASFRNKTSAGPCNAVEPWKKDIEEAFRIQLTNALNNNGFNVVEPELIRGHARDSFSAVENVHNKRTFKAAAYSIEAALKTFDICDKDASVEVEIKVTDVRSGNIAQTFSSQGKAPNKGSAVKADYKGSSFSTGVFKDSPIGLATQKVISDITDRLKKSYPNREIASEDYQIKTIPRSRSR